MTPLPLCADPALPVMLRFERRGVNGKHLRLSVNRLPFSAFFVWDRLFERMCLFLQRSRMMRNFS